MAARANEVKLIVDGRVPAAWVASFPATTPIFYSPKATSRPTSRWPLKPQSANLHVTGSHSKPINSSESDNATTRIPRDGDRSRDRIAGARSRTARAAGRRRVRCGDVAQLAGRTIGIVTNQSGVLSDGTSLVDAVRANAQIRVKALFAPEHGLRGDRDAGTYVPSVLPTRAAGCPCTASMVKRVTPRPACSTASTCSCSTFKTSARGRTPTCRRWRTLMESAKQYGKEIWVLDRPNPIGACASKVPYSIRRSNRSSGSTDSRAARTHDRRTRAALQRSLRHRREAARGEIARWSRDMLWADTKLRWTPTSPNVPYAFTRSCISRPA